MTWRRWWALEIMAGLGIMVTTLPLSLERYFINIGLVTLFAVFYFQRIQAQRNRHWHVE